MDSTGFMILLQVVLIMLNAVFACAEIAVISINDAKLERMANDGDKRAARLVELTSQPAKFLATIQVAITLSGFLGSAFAAENFSDVLVQWLIGLGVQIPEKTLDTIAVILITIILSYFTLVFGELVPKRVAMRKAETIGLGLSAPISTISKVFAPLVWLLTASTNGILRLLGIDPDAEDDEVSEEEIRMMVDVGSEKGTIDHQEKEFIQNVFEFDDLSAGEIATHRTDVLMLDLEDSMEEWKETLYSSGHSRYPVCDGTFDNIVGILNAKQYFRLEDKSRENVMEQVVYQPYFVPGSVKADVLFRNMRQNRENMAVVLDEYGGVDGIVTINDLIEQLVGDLYDDSTPEEVLIEAVGENEWKIKGSAPIDEVSEELGVVLPDEDYDTFNGFIIHAMEAVPQDGAEIDIEVSGLHIRGLEVRNHQVETALVKLVPAEPAEV